MTDIALVVMVALSLGTVILAKVVEGTPQVVIDGYTVDSTLTSPATLPLGRTALLVCRVSGIPHGQQTSYQWTCPNQPCLQTGYAGRKIDNNIIAINTTSTSDGGTYTCTVTAGGINSTKYFRISVTGGEAVHSFGRLIPNEGVISTASQLQPPNTASGDGRIECTVSSGTADFGYTSNDVHNGTTATYNIPAGDFNNFQNKEGICGSIYHLLFISRNTLPVVSVVGGGAGEDRLSLNFDSTGLTNNGITRVIVGYDRLDLGLPMVGQYQNNQQRSKVTFTSLVPGARYRITVWGTTTGQSRSTGPTVVERTTAPSVPSPPRAFTITRFFKDGIELNWLPPRETNGDIQHYIIRYILQNGTEQEITTTDNTNYYNLTGLEGGQTYYSFTVEAVNLADDASAQSNTIGSYTHNHTLSSPIPTITTPAITTPATTTTINTPTTKSDTLVPYIGSGAGCLLLVLVVVLAVIICCVVAVHRRGKRSRSTEHTPTLHYYSTPGHEQEEEPQVQIGAATHDTVRERTASFTPRTLYDEVEVKSVKPKPVVVPSEYQLPLVEVVKEDDQLQEAHNTVTIPESFYAQPDMTVKSNKKGEKGTTAGVEDPDVLYAEVDKPKKKKKKGKEKKEEQPQGDLYAVVDKTSKKKGKEKKTKEKEQQGDEDLYAEVDKTKKKGKKCQKDNKSNSFREAAVELDSPPPVPDRGLIYEPSADREASDQEQHHHQQQLLQQQQQLQKQEHEEGVEKQELQEQENTDPGKPSLN